MEEKEITYTNLAKFYELKGEEAKATYFRDQAAQVRGWTHDNRNLPVSDFRVYNSGTRIKPIVGYGEYLVQSEGHSPKNASQRFNNIMSRYQSDAKCRSPAMLSPLKASPSRRQSPSKQTINTASDAKPKNSASAAQSKSFINPPRDATPSHRPSPAKLSISSLNSTTPAFGKSETKTEVNQRPHVETPKSRPNMSKLSSNAPPLANSEPSPSPAKLSRPSELILPRELKQLPRRLAGYESAARSRPLPGQLSQAIRQPARRSIPFNEHEIRLQMKSVPRPRPVRAEISNLQVSRQQVAVSAQGSPRSKLQKPQNRTKSPRNRIKSPRNRTKSPRNKKSPRNRSKYNLRYRTPQRNGFGRNALRRPNR